MLFRSVTPEELLENIPELADIAQIECEKVAAMFSEDVQPLHYPLMASKIKQAVQDGVDGIVLTHGTDTMHYTSSALSFLCESLPIPVVIAGAQRSSDRASSDSALNLICAVTFASRADCSGVFVCMHGSSSDDFCFIHNGVAVRKMHTSRRDAFRSINSEPVAKVFPPGKIEMLSKTNNRDKKRKPVIYDKIEPEVALLKMHPGVNPALIDFLVSKGCRGIVIEGTGLGHTPFNKHDALSARNGEMKNAISRACAKIPVVMTSQCIFGSVNMNVYSTGRDLQVIGVIPGGDMLPEAALTKLMWAIANFPKDVKKKMQENLHGELSGRTTIGEFL